MSERLALRPASESDVDFYFEIPNCPEILARADHEPSARVPVRVVLARVVLATGTK